MRSPLRALRAAKQRAARRDTKTCRGRRRKINAWEIIDIPALDWGQPEAGSGEGELLLLLLLETSARGKIHS